MCTTCIYMYSLYFRNGYIVCIHKTYRDTLKKTIFSKTSNKADTGMLPNKLI